MIVKDKWIPLSELDLDNDDFNYYSIDTRDFHFGLSFRNDMHKDYDIIVKYGNRFMYTKDEVITLLNRYYNESGGGGSWRYFNIVGVGNWKLKYIRIRKVNDMFIICDSYDRAIRRDILNGMVDKENLYFSRE